MANNWSMFHGDAAHSGFVGSTDSGINSTTAPKLKILHTLQLGGSILSTPAVVDGKIYIGLANSHSAPGGNGGKFCKIDVVSGQIEKTYEWAINASERDSHGFTGMGCTPAVSGGKVFFSAFNGKFYCLDQATLNPLWITDLRYADAKHNQPVTNSSKANPSPVAAGWSSPVVAGSNVYVGMGEGENPDLFGFIYCLDAASGNVKWVYCTCQVVDGQPNPVNLLPPFVVQTPISAPFKVAPNNPAIRGCSVWSSIAYDSELNMIYACTGNPQPDGALPTKGYSNGLIALDATTGAFKGFYQAVPKSSYRVTDIDVDVGGSPTIFTRNGQKLVSFGCKNGGFFLLDAKTLQVVNWRQLLPYYNDGTQIPTVDPHTDPNSPASNEIMPHVTNETSNQFEGENWSGTYSTAAVNPQLGALYIGVGGKNYDLVSAGIDSTTTPFLRAMDWNTLKDVWPLDNSNPPRYAKCTPPMYTNNGESGLSLPVAVNDVVLMATTNISLYAFNAKDGTVLWQDQLGSQTGGFTGGYGYCMGPAVWGNFIIAGALVYGLDGGILRIYGF